MDNYYRLLEVNYNEPTQIVINACKKKIFEYKALPYLSDDEKNILKQLKKAYYIFNNPEFKKKYDEIYLKNFNNNLEFNNLEFNNNQNNSYFEFNNDDNQETNQTVNTSYFEFPNNDNQEINNQFIKDPRRNNQTADIRLNKKNIENQNYLVDRIFGFQNTNLNKYNVQQNELLRPKNAGLSSDEVVEFDKPIDYQESSDFLPHNFDS